MTTVDVDQILGSIEKTYSTKEAAAFLNRTDQWVYFIKGQGKFVHEDGTPILPIGDTGKRMRFTLLNIKEIAAHQYQRGNYSEEEMELVSRRIAVAARGGDWKTVEMNEFKGESTE